MAKKRSYRPAKKRPRKRGRKRKPEHGSTTLEDRAGVNWEKEIAERNRELELMRKIVIVEKLPAIQCIEKYDSERTCFYLDPPYLASTRSSIGDRGHRAAYYEHEMSVDDHVQLLEVAKACRGKVLLGCYENEMYSTHLEGWKPVYAAAWADGGKKRREVLWLNPAAAAANLQTMLVLA